MLFSIISRKKFSMLLGRGINKKVYFIAQIKALYIAHRSKITIITFHTFHFSLSRIEIISLKGII